VSPPATKPEARIVPRAGFGRVATKLSQEPVSLCCFGASVTAQKEGYRPLLHERLASSFGQDHTSLFAGIGGVDIVCAAFLADEFVVRHRPDLCLVEFTTAGLMWGSSLAEAEGAMDGVVAKLRTAGIQPCLLHLARKDWRDDHADLLAAFERVAEHHGIPSIDLTGPFLDSTHADGMFRDPVHTTAAGSELAAELVARAIDAIAAEDLPAGPTEQPPAPTSDGFRDAQVLPPAAEDADGLAEMRLFRLQRPYLELPAGSAIGRRFSDRVAGLVMVVGPESGELEVTDASGKQRLMTWDEWCHYERFQACLFERPCEAGEVSIELTETVPDYARCRRPVEPPERLSAKVIGYMVLPG
jgi:lysophospholipase L1-like esterase